MSVRTGVLGCAALATLVVRAAHCRAYGLPYGALRLPVPPPRRVAQATAPVRVREAYGSVR